MIRPPKTTPKLDLGPRDWEEDILSANEGTEPLVIEDKFCQTCGQRFQGQPKRSFCQPCARTARPVRVHSTGEDKTEEVPTVPPPLRRDPKEGDPPTAALAGSRGPVGGDPSRVEDELLEKIIRPAAQEAIDKAYLRGYEDGYRKASGLRSMSDSDHKILSSLFAGAINASCTENVSDTPDLLLAEAATGVLDIFQTLINKRTAYYEQ